MTSASVWGWSDRKPLRVGIALAATFDSLWLGGMTRFDVANDWQHADPGPIFGGLAQTPWLHALVVLASVLSLWWFALAGRSRWAGPAALALLFLVYETNAFATGFVMPEMHVAGSALLGWILGARLAAFVGPQVSDGQASGEQLAKWQVVAEDRLAEAGAVAGIVANYGMSALSKWLAAGWQWDGRIIRRLLFAFRQVDDQAWTGAVADWLAWHPWLPEALALGTMAIQSGAVLMLAGPRLRVLWGLLLVAMHATMTVTTGVFDPQLAVIVGFFCLPWPDWLKRTAPAPQAVAVDSRRVRTALARSAAIGAALGGLAWALPIRQHMTVRFNVSQTPWDRKNISRQDGKPETQPSRAPASPAVAAWLGPLRAGAPLGAGTIAFVADVQDGGIGVQVHLPAGDVWLAIHRADPAAPRPPAAKGNLAVYYAGSAAEGPQLAEQLAAQLPAAAPPDNLGPMRQ